MSQEERRMAGKNGRTPGSNDDRDPLEAAADLGEGEYDAMMLLDQLESLEEEMEELGVSTLDELRTRIRDLHAELGD
jgi:hypothetical protein